jgi:hypothetical protein
MLLHILDEGGAKLNAKQLLESLHTIATGLRHWHAPRLHLDITTTTQLDALVALVDYAQSDKSRDWMPALQVLNLSANVIVPICIRQAKEARLAEGPTPIITWLQGMELPQRPVSSGLLQFVTKKIMHENNRKLAVMKNWFRFQRATWDGYIMYLRELWQTARPGPNAAKITRFLARYPPFVAAFEEGADELQPMSVAEDGTVTWPGLDEIRARIRPFAVFCLIGRRELAVEFLGQGNRFAITDQELSFLQDHSKPSLRVLQLATQEPARPVRVTAQAMLALVRRWRRANTKTDAAFHMIKYGRAVDTLDQLERTLQQLQPLAILPRNVAVTMMEDLLRSAI